MHQKKTKNNVLAHFWNTVREQDVITFGVKINSWTHPFVFIVLFRHDLTISFVVSLRGLIIDSRLPLAQMLMLFRASRRVITACRAGGVVEDESGLSPCCTRAAVNGLEVASRDQSRDNRLQRSA